jgi:cilia- and flagella-associated protein 65
VQVRTQCFHVTNQGDLPLSFSWKTPAPFSIAPASSAELSPGKTQHFSISFTASNASVYTAAAYCLLSNGTSNSVKLSAIGKFPFLALDTATIEHGSVLVGQTAKRTVKLLNQALVPAHFKVVHTGAHDDGVFSVAPAQGTIEPNAAASLAVRYKPHFAGTFSSETFGISTPGGNVVSLQARGAALGATVAVSERSLDFGDVPLGKAAKKVSSAHAPFASGSKLHTLPESLVFLHSCGLRVHACVTLVEIVQVLTIENKSPVAVAYTTAMESKGVFSVEKRFGVLKPNLLATVCVTFRPQGTCNSWKRLSICLAGTDPLDVDLLGTGYSDDTRPPPLSIDHIDSFLQRIADGGSILPPAQTEDGSLPSTPLQLRPDLPAPAGANGYHSWDLLFLGQDAAHALGAEPSTLTFSPAASSSQGVESQSVTVTNRMPFKITCSLAVPLWLDPRREAEPCQVWQVQPASQDIAPGASAAFSVAFKTPADGRYFTQAVDLVAHAKYMRNFQLCSEVRTCGFTLPPTHSRSHRDIQMSTSIQAHAPHQTSHDVPRTSAARSEDFTLRRAESYHHSSEP